MELKKKGKGMLNMSRIKLLSLHVVYTLITVHIHSPTHRHTIYFQWLLPCIWICSYFLTKTKFQVVFRIIIIKLQPPARIVPFYSYLDNLKLTVIELEFGFVSISSFRFHPPVFYLLLLLFWDFGMIIYDFKETRHSYTAEEMNFSY